MTLRMAVLIKAPHLESMIKTQRILCCKKFASNEPSSWKTTLSYYLKSVGGKFILSCNFDVKKLRVKLPRFYEECLSCFAQCSVASRMNSYDISQETLSEVIIWNNKHICVDGKSVYNCRLVDKGIISLGDLALGKNGLAPWGDFWKLDISPLDAFQLIALCDALPTEYRQSLQIYQYVNLEPFDSENHSQLCLNGQNVALS